MKYLAPRVETMEAATELLASSSPNAGDIGAPDVDDNVKEYSVWDKINDTYNINKEEDYEVHD